MIETSSELTWLEEWFLFFELIQGSCDLGNISYLAGTYETTRRTATKIITTKLKICIDSMAQWPRFLTEEEDKDFQTIEWKGEYSNK